MESASPRSSQRVLIGIAFALILTLVACSTAAPTTPGSEPASESSGEQTGPARAVLVLSSSTSTDDKPEFIPFFDDVDDEADADEAGYQGPLSWHVTSFDEVATEDIDDPMFKGRSMSGAHCYFAARPNKDTPIFALLVRHMRHGDLLYLGRHNMATTRVDTVPLTDRGKSPITVDLTSLHCLFREDQNEAGAIIFGYRYVDAPEDELKYALAWVEVPNAREATQQVLTVPDPSFGKAITGTPTINVRAERYVRPDSKIIGSFEDIDEAIAAAEGEIPRGRFRLRPENSYPYMTWQSYLGGKPNEFCPAQTECREREFDFVDYDAMQSE